MPRRIEIELTSRADDGTWTWRAAGARQPRGSFAADLAPGGASVGDVVRAEVQSGLDGIEILAILPPKPVRADLPVEGRIEVIGSPQRGPDVSVTLAPGSRRRRDDDRPRRDGAGRREGGRREGGRRDDERPRREGPGRIEGRGRRDGAGRPAASGGGERRGGPEREEAGRPAGRRERRPSVSTAHRNVMLSELRPEQLPVAEQLLRGGIPAVRQAIEEQNATARAEGKPPASADALLAMAEQLLPAVKLAEWKDRATSAQAAGKDLRLRELRAVVAASRTVTLDDDGRTLAKALQESLDHRVNALREEWVSRITAALDQERVLDALRASIRAPEPGTRCPAELAVRLATAAGGAMSADASEEEWLALLEAVLESPVRRTVKPTGIPAGEAVQVAARHAAGLVPELAKLLGLPIPPPPPRRVPARRPLSPTGGGGSAAGL